MIIYAIILISSIGICFQDFTSRLIHLYWLAALGISTIVYNIVQEKNFFYFFIVNCFFLAATFLILWLYVIIKERRKTKLIDRYIGLGDIIVLALLATSYNLHNLIILILTGSIGGLLFYAFSYRKRKTVIRIPLAGILAILHSILLFYSLHLKIDTFYDSIL